MSQDLGATPVQGSAELSSLETQLDEAIRELEEVRRSEIGQREAIRSADERVRSVTERLSGAEAQLQCVIVRFQSGVFQVSYVFSCQTCSCGGESRGESEDAAVSRRL